jgi:Raf kinase inhibitor-like YbhB/YbcL family protein
VHEGNAFGCNGGNVPPALSWSSAPASSRSFALTVIDPDAPKAGGFVHWIVYNIPGSRHTLNTATLRAASQGKNDAGMAHYFGPCPPAGRGPHHYHFTLYALSLRHIRGSHLDLGPLRLAIKHHVLAKATLIGTFERTS